MLDDPPPSLTPNTIIRHSSASIVRRQTRAPASGWRNAKWFYMLLSFVLGAFLWAGIDMKRMQESDLEVELGIQQIMPAGWMNTVLSDEKIVVSIRGAKQIISTIREDGLNIAPNIPPEAFDGDIFEGRLGISPSQMQGLPPGIQAFAVKPEVITVRFDKVVTRHLPVEPGEIVGVPAPGYIVGKIGSPDPSDLPITGPKILLDNLGPDDVIRTGSLDIEGKRGVVKEWIRPLPFVKGGRTFEISELVGLTVELTEAPVIKILEQPVDVKALIDAPFERYDHLTLTPPTVTVTVSGEQSAVESLNPGEIVVYADIRERLPAAPDEYLMKCRFLAPARIHVVKIEPDTVKWVTRETAAISREEP